MKKLCACLFVGIFILCLLPRSVAAQSEGWPGLDNALEEQLSGMDMQGVEEFIGALEEKPSWSGDILALLRAAAKGQAFASGQEWLSAIGQLLVRAMVGQMGLMMQIIAAALLTGLLESFRQGLDHYTGEVAAMVCRAAVLLMMISSAYQLLQETIKAVSVMNGWMNIIFPMLITLTASVGAVASAAAFQPIIIFLTSGVGRVIETILLPLVQALMGITILNRFSAKVQLDHLAGLLASIVKWSLGCIMTIFIGIIAMHGITASVADGVSFRTAKYAVDALVPVVGKMFSQTMDTIWSCTLLVKNGVGVVGMLLLGWICLLPAAKIAGGMILYRTASAFLQPVAEDAVVGALRSMADVFALMLAIVLTVGLLFLMLIAMFVVSGNAAFMLR